MSSLLVTDVANIRRYGDMYSVIDCLSYVCGLQRKEAYTQWNQIKRSMASYARSVKRVDYCEPDSLVPILNAAHASVDMRKRDELLKRLEVIPSVRLDPDGNACLVDLLQVTCKMSERDVRRWLNTHRYSESYVFDGESTPVVDRETASSILRSHGVVDEVVDKIQSGEKKKLVGMAIQLAQMNVELSKMIFNFF